MPTSSEEPQPEPCDWCGRPAARVQFEASQESRLLFRDPALCRVCRLILQASGDIEGAWEDIRARWEDELDGEEALSEFDGVLSQKWLDRGEHPGARSSLVGIVRIASEPVGDDEIRRLVEHAAVSGRLAPMLSEMLIRLRATGTAQDDIEAWLRREIEGSGQ